MRFSNAKKIIALALVLLLCVVGCVALFVLSGQQEGKTPVSEDTQQEADTVMKDIAAIDPSRQRYLFRLAEQREEPVGEPGTYYQKYFLLDGQIVRLVPGKRTTSTMISVTSVVQCCKAFLPEIFSPCLKTRTKYIPVCLLTVKEHFGV